MGDVVELVRAKKDDTNAHSAEAAFVEQFTDYAHRAWHPIRGLKRGCAQAVARVAFRASDGGREWLKINPADLLLACLPQTWGQETIDLATNMAMLFWHYLLESGAISAADMAFCEGWTYGAQVVLYRALLNARPQSAGLYARTYSNPASSLQRHGETEARVRQQRDDE